jgi:hypothetical protein
MSFRLVPKQIALTAADAEAAVVQDTGGSVVPTGNTIAIGDGTNAGWSVEVFSMDGLSTPHAATGRTVFSVISISENGETATLRDYTGFDFNVSRILPEFLGTFITLEVGQRVSGVLLEHSIGEDVAIIKDALIEDDLRERREFEGASEDVQGWAPYSNPAPPAGSIKK